MASFKSLRSSTILVVDDDQLVQLELSEWLADLGLAVLTADNADEAIALLDCRADIQFLLTDIQMPGSMDGVRLAHHVAHRWPPVRIIVLSGVFGTPLATLPAGSTFISKPCQPNVLWRALTGADDPASAA